MVERRGRAPVASFFSPEPLATAAPERSDAEQPVRQPIAVGSTISLGEDAAHHARVRRIDVGECVRLLDGAGAVATGTLLRVSKSTLAVEIGDVIIVEPPPAVHLLVPVADRDRMLWLGEKCAELGLTSWRPVLWRRSRSVTPRGEGSGFQRKLRARMAAALEQSGGAWLPVLYPDAKPEHAIAATPGGSRVLLAPGGESVLGLRTAAPVSLALGPEGGLDDDEVEALVAAGFAPAALAGNILRFETAGIAALAIVRAALALSGASAHAE